MSACKADDVAYREAVMSQIARVQLFPSQMV